MELKRLEIKKLFGEFDYTIPFDAQEDITILTGPNGYGKTTILNMVDSLFNQRFYFFRKVNFESATFVFANEKQLHVTTSKEKQITQSIRSINGQSKVVVQETEIIDVSINFMYQGKTTDTFVYNADAEKKLIRGISRFIPIQRSAQNFVLDMRTGKQLLLENFLNDNWRNLPLKTVALINLNNAQGKKKRADSRAFRFSTCLSH